MKNVLIIDDDRHLRRLVQMGVEKLGGWKVWLAASGSEALDMARVAAPDAIVIDVVMPGMDGITTLRQLRGIAETRNTPVLLLTAIEPGLDRSRLAGLDVQAVLGKPCSVSGLITQLGRMLGEPAGKGRKA